MVRGRSRSAVKVLGPVVMSLLIFVPSSARASRLGRPELLPSMTVVGDARLATGELRLTSATPFQVGAAWVDHEVLVTDGFTAHFALRIGKGSGADGLAFVIQASAGDAIGAYGGGLGYGEDDWTPELEGIPNSVAVEFDTFSNWEEEDPIGNHISVHTRGTLGNDQSERYSLGSTTAIPLLTDGHAHRFTVEYVPGSLTIMDARGQVLLAVPMDLSTLLDLDAGTAWIGFTAGTGEVSESHDILSVEISSGD